MNLRPYQIEAVSQLKANLHRSPILVAPTGSGKTVVAVEFVRAMGVPTLWIAHRRELIQQASDHLRELGLETGIIQAGYASHPASLIQVASVQTLARRELYSWTFDLIVIDECHHATSRSYATALEAYPDASLVGLTATPFRLDGKGLGDIFGHIVVAAKSRDLVDAGYLHAPKVYSHSTPNLSGVKKLAGEYHLGQLDEAVNQPKLIGDIVDTWLSKAACRRTVVFATTVLHSQAIVAAFQDAGVEAEHLDGSTPKDIRDSILTDLREGSVEVVSNCMVLTEGWDLPTLECAIIARPTASLNLHLQMLGRIMRSAEDKDGCIVLDHAGNHHVHGTVLRDIEYTLDGLVKKPGEKPDLKTCPVCFIMVPIATQVCPDCGHVFAAETTGPATGDGELTEFDDETYEYRRDWWLQTEMERQRCGYQKGWSWYRFKERFGTTPVTVDGYLIDPSHASMDDKRAVWNQLNAVRLEKGFKAGWVAHKYKDIFGVWPRGVEDSLTKLQKKWDRSVV